MVRVVEDVRLADGFTVKQLSHYRCGSCGARFFDDQAMKTTQVRREVGTFLGSCLLTKVGEDLAQPLK